MESPFSTLAFLFFGFLISFCTILVESQSRDGATDLSSNPPLIPPPPPPPLRPRSPLPPEHPPPLPRSPPSPEHPPPPTISLPSPENPFRPPQPSPNQFNSKNEPIRSLPPSRHWSPKRSKHRQRRPPPPPPPPPPPHSNKINTGKKVGLLFAGVASLLQFGVVGFLAFKRRQLLKVDSIVCRLCR